MKKTLLFTVLGAMLLLGAGCSTQFPSIGWVDNDVRPDYRGISEVRYLTCTPIPILLDGDASISAAMKEGGIKKVHHIDTETENTLFMMYRRTIVYGEK